MAERIVVLGGTRSGKSAIAERLAAGAAAVRYVATARPADPELRERIAVHRARRPSSWQTVETADLEAAVREAPASSAVLIDALGTWLAARMDDLGLWPESDVAVWDEAFSAGRSAIIAEAEAAWKAAAAHPGGPVALVAEEVGLGLVPPAAGARRWVDLAGEIVQRLSADADRVLLVVAGRAIDLPVDVELARAGYLGAVPATRSPRPGRDRASAAPISDAGEEALSRAHGDTMVPPGALDFAVNVHGSGPPAHIRAALREADTDAGRYPDDARAREAVALRHGRGIDNVCATAGAAEALWLAAAAACAGGARQATLVHPSFTEPEAALRHAGIPVRRVRRREQDDWRLDPSAIPGDADLVVLGNPNNPTGALDPPEAVAAICRPGRVTVVDEAFMDFVADPGASVAGRDDLPGLVVVRSVTKLWGLAGVRAGYLLAGPEFAARCAAARQPWSVGVHALAALRVCAADEDYRLQVAEEVAQARRRLVAQLEALGSLRLWEGAANFVLARLADADDLHARLLERGVAVRPSTFPGLEPGFVRIAVRDPEASRRLVAAIADIARSSR